MGSVPFAACTVKVNIPGAVGIPLNTPPLERLNPVGSTPDATVQAMVGLPLAPKVKLYAAPTLPVAGGVPLVMVGATGVTTVPQPAVSMAIEPAPSLTVAAAQLAPFTVTVCA